MEEYAELHCWSNFTFLEGASKPEDLVERAFELQLKALALTDRDGLYGTVRFAKHAKDCHFPAIIGSELTIEDATHVVLLVENECGYSNLCELISTAQLRGSKGNARLHIEDFDTRSDGLIALSQSTDRHRALALHERFGERLYFELQQHRHRQDTHRCNTLLTLGKRFGVRCVATNGVVYAQKENAQLADVLFCIKHGITLAQATRDAKLRANAEYHLKSPQEMSRLFAPFPEAIRNTLEIAERCKFRLDRLDGQFPLFPVPNGRKPQEYLRELTFHGAQDRYGTPLDIKVKEQLEHELTLIEKQQLAGYFLIVWDIVRMAHELGVLCQGRGSAANSAVCYALGITAVDPVGMELLFERFMSEGREEIPDIDIDFAHQDREKVIQYVYNRYDRVHAAMVAEVITYGLRSAARDVGKALGLSLAQVDTNARELEGHGSLEAIDNAQLVAFCRQIQNFPRHLGIHSGGLIITRDPLVRVAPVERATMAERTVVQWDKDDLQDLGLIKIDLLGLGMLSLLREAFTLHERVYGTKLALHTIPQNDPQTYEMIQRADTVGVFQIESRAQQSMLPRMKPTCFYDIVMQVAIIRPGPIQGQMVHPFLRRRAGQELVTYPHPKLEPILKRTLGVPLFQEQGMRMAIEAGGFSPGEADLLRRAMGHKRSRQRMREIYPKLVDGFVRNGIDRKAANDLFRMLQGFADYGFPESHAASFALLAYASAYLKCHHPAIFAAAILNVQPMGFYSTEVLVNDARRHGVVIKQVEVNASEFWTHVDAEGALRLGFHIIRGLGEAQRAQLETALAQGPFEDLRSFARRTGLSKDAIENLAAAGTFSPWFHSRREAMWALRGLDEREARGTLGRLMDVKEPVVHFAPLSDRQETAFDLWATGVAPKEQPMVHFRSFLDDQHVVPAARLSELRSNVHCRVGGLVITRQQPETAKGFVFLTLEDETGLVNVIVRPDIFERYQRVICRSSALIIDGVLQSESGCIDVLARQFKAFDTGGMVDCIGARNFQ